MATQFKDAMPFLVFKATADEFLAAGFGASENVHEDVITEGIFAGFSTITIEGGGWLVCDTCNEEIKGSENGYYVAVLGRILCEECFKDWLANATYYPEDFPYELKNFRYCEDMLNSARINIDKPIRQ